MRKRDWLIGAAAASLLIAMTWFLLPKPPVSFRDVEEARAVISAEGYHCTPDRADGKVGSGFLVSRDATSWKAANELCKAGLIGPDWKGKIWVGYGSLGRAPSIPANARAVNWGGVYAYGDLDFLTEVDASLRARG